MSGLNTLTIAAARELGVPLGEILAGLCEVPPTARRLECKKIGDFFVIDDTYNSNLASARVDPDGTVTDLYTECDGRPLRSPNDIVMDGHGGFWFTDHGKQRPRE